MKERQFSSVDTSRATVSPYSMIPIILLFLFILNQSVAAVEKPFKMNVDNSITVDGIHFKSMKDYINSGYIRESGRRCGAAGRYSHRSVRGVPQGSQADCSLSRTIIKTEYNATTVMVIPIVFHVIYKSDGTGNISNADIASQINVLNEDFRAIAGSLGGDGNDTKIQFRLEAVTRTQNNDWFNDSDEYAYKNTLGRDQDRFLNIYSNTASGYLGYSTMPQESAGDVYDGVVVNYETVGGRDNGLADYDQGRTLVHEIGHYLGLLHTFDGDGCYEGYEAGDLIADTESENTEHYSCVQTYTCGTPDPIHNYMNYTDDLCMTEFTPEQANRMACSIKNYRPALYSAGGESISISSPNGGEVWQAGSTQTVAWVSVSSRKGSMTASNVRVQYSLNNGSTWVNISSSTPDDGSYSWKLPDGVNSSQCIVRVKDASDGIPSDVSDAVFSIVSGDVGSITPNLSQLYFSANGSSAVTPGQDVMLNVSGGLPVWTASPGGSSWLSVSPSSGTGAAILTISVNPAGLTPGVYNGSITISSANASNSPQTVTVTFTVRNAYEDQYPFGEFSTPADGVTGVTGSLPVTGWALDDAGVQSVKIYRTSSRGDVLIGDAVFVPGARPDVESAYPHYPQNHRAGWGYMLLTNTLPGNGNGTFTLKAVAVDVAGKTKTLGTARITCVNASAAKPFGALETPSQGGSASGKSFYNWGWVLTPPPYGIPVDGRTITVYVDGSALGHPVYNLYRADVAALFPGYVNSNGAFGYYIIDTTRYDNGLHSIQWVVSDNGGRQDGIGSRYFSIFNPSSSSRPANSVENEWEGLSPDADFPAMPAAPVLFSESFAGNGSMPIHRAICADDAGIYRVAIRELENMEICLAGVLTPPSSAYPKRFLGFMAVNGSRYPLPVGSTFDSGSGVFRWSPGAGFIGDYLLLFFDKEIRASIRVAVSIKPRFSPSQKY